MPGKAVKNASKGKAKSASKAAGKRGRPAGMKVKKSQESFASYIFKTLKNSEAKEKNMKKSTMSSCNSICNDIFDRVAREASNMLKFNKRQTMTGRDIQLACRVLFPKDIYEHVHEQAEGALKAYDRSVAAK